MSQDKTDYHEQQVMDRVFDNAAPDGAVDGCHVALWATSPANNPDTANEIDGNQYSPVQVPAAEWSLATAANPRQYENDNEIDFGALDDSSQITIEGVVLYDGADTSTANALYADALTETKTVDAGDEFKFNPGDLDVSED